jgi:hypothetical protein
MVGDFLGAENVLYRQNHTFVHVRGAEQLLASSVCRNVIWIIQNGKDTEYGSVLTSAQTIDPSVRDHQFRLGALEKQWY